MLECGTSKQPREEHLFVHVPSGRRLATVQLRDVDDFIRLRLVLEDPPV